jgi:hypothetical protein
MRTFKALRGVAVAGCVAMGVLLMIAGGALASGAKLCISEKEGGPVKTPKGGVCPKKYKLMELGEPSALSEAEQEELKEIRKYVKVIPSGIDGKPTVQVTGANVQIVNGEGKTATTNGEGNLVIGYDENTGTERIGGMPGKQTGSHNLILGIEQEYTSFGGLVAGETSSVTAPWASVTGGSSNTARAPWASVTGGSVNTASGEAASVSGGLGNTASERWASVSGGQENTASGFISSISGGLRNTASNEEASVSGGYKNAAGFNFSSIFGGKELSTKADYEAIP